MPTGRRRADRLEDDKKKLADQIKERQLELGLEVEGLDRSHEPFRERIKYNEEEKAFADAWESANAGRYPQTLIGIMGGTVGNITPRDRIIAASVVQWLGTRVGWNLVLRVIESSKGLRESVVWMLSRAEQAIRRDCGVAWVLDNAEVVRDATRLSEAFRETVADMLCFELLTVRLLKLHRARLKEVMRSHEMLMEVAEELALERQREKAAEDSANFRRRIDAKDPTEE